MCSCSMAMGTNRDDSAWENDFNSIVFFFYVDVRVCMRWGFDCVDSPMAGVRCNEWGDIHLNAAWNRHEVEVNSRPAERQQKKETNKKSCLSFYVLYFMLYIIIISKFRMQFVVGVGSGMESGRLRTPILRTKSHRHSKHMTLFQPRLILASFHTKHWITSNAN